MNDVNVMKKLVLSVILAIIMMNTATAILTRGQVDEAIARAERDVAEMQAGGLSINFVNNTLNTAKMLLEGKLTNESFEEFAALCRAYSKESIKRYCLSQLSALSFYASRENATSKELIEENYPKIIELTDKIDESKKQAFEARDLITAIESKMQEYKVLDIDITIAELTLQDAKEAILEERYDDALELATRTDTELESKRAEISLAKTLLLASRGFFVKNAGALIRTLIVVLIIAAIAQHPLRIYMLKKKITRLNAEEKALHMLMKDAQKKRFASGKITESMYNIKMQVYKKKLDYVKENLPLAEKKLQRLLRFEGFRKLKQKLKEKIQGMRWFKKVEKPVERFVFVESKPLQTYEPKKNVKGFERVKESVKGVMFVKEKKK